MSIISPVWAANGDKVPAPDDEKIDLGWVGGDRPTIEYLNFILNRADNAANVGIGLAASVGVANLHLTNDPGSGLDMCAFHPGMGSGSGRWLVSDTLNNPTYYSDDNGYTWSGSTPVSSISYPAQATIDTTRFIVAAGVGIVKHSVDATTWLTDGGAATAGAGAAVTSIFTKYPDSVFCAVGCADGEIYIAAAGVADDGTYVPSSTQPPGGGDDIISIKHDGSNTFYCLDNIGETYVSSDGACAVWADTATAPADVATVLDTYKCMDYDVDNTTLCVSGEDTGAQVVEILRSDDNGATWAVADVSNISVSSDIEDIRHLGGLVWVACGDDVYANIFVSYDGGLTWHEGRFHASAAPTEAASIVSNGSMIMIGCDTVLFASGAVPGLSNL